MATVKCFLVKEHDRIPKSCDILPAGWFNPVTFYYPSQSQSPSSGIIRQLFDPEDRGLRTKLLFRPNSPRGPLGSTSYIHKSTECTLFLKSIPWRLAEFYYNTGLQRPYSGTCTILQRTINKFLCQHIN